MRPLSLRNRLVLGVVALLAVALLVADFAGLMLFRSFLLQRVDDQLQAPFGSRASGELQTWLAQLCDGGAGTDTVELPTTFTVLVVDTQGRVTCQLPQTAHQAAMSFTAEQLRQAAVDGTVITLDPPPGSHSASRARVVALDSGYVVLTMSLSEVDSSTARLARIFLSVGLIIVAAATLAGTAIVRIGLRPLTRIENTAEQIAAGDLTQRIEVGSPRTEVGRLAVSLNSMLAQIEAAFTERDKTEHRLRRFVADASHELRTPLATIRGHAELLSTGIASEPDDVARVVGRIESESIRMSGLVDDLLLLARLDTTRILEHRPVDLLTIAVDGVADTRVRAPERTLEVRNPTHEPWRDAPAIVLGDSARLQQVLTNLLSNATKYTPPDTPIEIEIGVIGDRAHLAVIDHGAGLHAGNEEKVFERFFREDAGRGRTRGGAGLGLAIAWSLIDKHGGTLRYEPTPGGGSTFVADLPLSEV